ncbi:lipopolysaccharide biosynthesis protein [Methanospirillum lacunae]|uniref:Polysaccharide biosynthesis protein n=1 Tax=Methanospirillum lacunae TaxID=668570 RepID=A0A2V2NB27_9EURY|nr:oligosaccharide flippase family protein [Methanospirillum lacunae]PWR72771.1 polysaccharide biosynthesis protein [Methanospirillum lacunae]
MTSSFFTSKQMGKNFLGNMLYFLLNIVIGLFLVPFFISTLGIAAYGIIPLATSINGYIGLLTDSLNSSVSRFLSVNIQREDYLSANITFNTAFFGITAFIFLLFPVIIIISLYAPILFSIQDSQKGEVFFLFFGICNTFLIRAWSGNFTVSLFAYNRLDLINLINITGTILQILFIIIFFKIISPSLALVGLAYLISGIVTTTFSIFLSHLINPDLKISYHDFDRSRLNDFMGMSWWVVINQVGSLLFLNIDLIVINLYFGAKMGGEYAIALQWVILLRGIAGTVAGLLTPVMLMYYAKEQIESLIRVSKSAVKLMGLFVALPIGLVCGFASQLIFIWVGSEFVFLAPLTIVLVIHLMVNLAVLPLFAINIAHNKVKVPGIITFIMGIGNLLLAIFLSLYSGLGYYGVAVAAAITLTLKNAIFTPWYATRVLQVPSYTFTKSMLPGIISTISIIMVSRIFITFEPVWTFFNLVFVGGAISIIYLILIIKFGLNEYEFNLFSAYIPICFRRFFDEAFISEKRQKS